MHEGSQRAIVAALLANAGIAAAKFVGAAITGSSAMLAEGIHSVADSGNQALLLLGGRQAKRGPSEEHPFGYGRARYFWAFVVALVLFSVGGLFAVYEGIEKLRHPHELTSPQWAIGILLIALGLELVSLRIAVRESNKLRGSQSWWRFLRRSKNPELPVVVLEDLGALLGLIFALVGVGLTMITGEARFDAAATLAIGVLLVTIAVFLASEMKSLLIGEGASEEDLLRIQASLEGGPEVRSLIHMRTEHLGPDQILVAAKVEYDSRLTFDEVADAIDASEANVRAVVPAARLIYIEPDLKRTVVAE
jgi:cation diffusion facilitator family transporter